MIKTRDSLAVHYRPIRFDQLIGQEDVISLLKGQFKSKEGISRSYMITGVTGCGKTTLARMMAHYANCENFDHANCEPCGECEYCQQVAYGVYPDVEEINFSESRGIDTIRDVLDSSRYDSRYNVKVYIMDELQGMTGPAQNALLKFLEEPPSHVMILLLTTDAHKILDTVKNRCCPLNLQPVDDESLIGFLQYIVKMEKKDFIGDAVYRRIALNSRGRVRQAVAALEAIMYSIEGDDNFDQTDTEKLDNIIGRFVPTPEVDFFKYLIEGVYQGKYAHSLMCVQDLIPKFSNPVYMFSTLYEYHMQTLFLLVDPKRNYPRLTDPGYTGWYKTLIETAKNGKLFVTHQAAAEICEILLDLVQKAGTYQHDVKQLFLSSTLKMIQSITTHKPLAYTTASVFHKIHAEDKLKTVEDTESMETFLMSQTNQPKKVANG